MQWLMIFSFNPRLYRMIFDVLRFNLYALDLLKQEEGKEGKELSIGEYLDREGYGEGFKEDYLLVSGLSMITSVA
jgi:predicted NAD/FAD-binding protein